MISHSSISTDTSSRLALMSFVCACLVVPIHFAHPTSGISGWLTRGLYGGVSNIAVPVFFCISGYLLCGKIAEGGYADAVHKRLRTLLIPFIIWGIIGFLAPLPIALLHDIRTHQTPGAAFFSQVNWYDFAVNWFGLDFTQMPLYGPLWYLRNLFLLVVLSPMIYKAIRSFSWYWVGGVFVVFCAWRGLESQCCENLNGFFWHGFSLSGLTAFSLGMLLRDGDYHLSKWQYGLVSLCIGIAIWCGWHLAGLALSYLWPVFLLSIGYAVWTLLPLIPLPKFILRASFPIYLIHSIIIGYLQSFPGSIPGPSCVIGLFIHWLVPIIAAVICSWGLHRWLPKISSIIFGGR